MGISACLLGLPLRYDGGHKRERRLVEVLGPLVEWLPVCPEAECGLGVPREAMRLVGPNGGRLRLLTLRTGRDLTAQLRSWLAPALDRLAREKLAGFVLKARSPSCARRDAAYHDAQGAARGRGPGLFARALAARLPRLPVADEQELRDAARRRAFLARVFGPPGPGCYRYTSLLRCPKATTRTSKRRS